MSAAVLATCLARVRIAFPCVQREREGDGVRIAYSCTGSKRGQARLSAYLMMFQSAFEEVRDADEKNNFKPAAGLVYPLPTSPIGGLNLPVP
jgi:hypothetical protein